MVRMRILTLAGLPLELGFLLSVAGGPFLGFIQALGIKAELTYLRDRFVLVGGFDHAVGLFAAGIDGRIGEFGHSLLSGSGIFQHFLNGGFAIEDAAQAVGAKGGHAKLNGLLPDDDGGRALGDKFTDGL